MEISQIPLVPSFAADMLEKEQSMLVADVYIMLCLRHNMLKQCSPPLMLLLMRKEAKYAIRYASIMGLSLALCLLVDTSFAPRDSPRPLKNNWPFHALPLALGASSASKVHSFTRYC